MEMEANGKISHRISDFLLSFQSKRKKGKMTNTFITDSNKEAIVEFMEDHEELSMIRHTTLQKYSLEG